MLRSGSARWQKESSRDGRGGTKWTGRSKDYGRTMSGSNFMMPRGLQLPLACGLVEEPLSEDRFLPGRSDGDRVLRVVRVNQVQQNGA